MRNGSRYYFHGDLDRMYCDIYIVIYTAGRMSRNSRDSMKETREMSHEMTSDAFSTWININDGIPEGNR